MVLTQQKKFPFLVYQSNESGCVFFHVYQEGLRIFTIHFCEGEYVLTEKGMGAVFFTQEKDRPISTSLDEILTIIHKLLSSFFESYSQKKSLSAS